MKQIFVLSKLDLKLSKQEVLRLYNTANFELIGNLLIINTNKDYSDRLAYTNEIYEYLFETKKLEKYVGGFDWQKVYSKSFSLEAKSLDAKALSSIIWKKIKNPKVDLENAKTKIKIFSVKNKFVVGKLLNKTNPKFNERKAHKRASPHPTSLDPKLARAVINLSGKTKGKILDPFCGSGGLLIEASILGFDIFGYDIDEKMLRMCQINLEDYQIKRYDLTIKDAGCIKGKFDAIITDLPYGRNSKVNNKLKKTYQKFLESAYTSTDTAIVMFPDFAQTKPLLGKWKKKLEFNYFLHKSLSKKILVLEK